MAAPEELEEGVDWIRIGSGFALWTILVVFIMSFLSEPMSEPGASDQAGWWLAMLGVLVLGVFVARMGNAVLFDKREPGGLALTLGLLGLLFWGIPLLLAIGIVYLMNAMTGGVAAGLLLGWLKK